MSNTHNYRIELRVTLPLSSSVAYKRLLVDMKLNTYRNLKAILAREIDLSDELDSGNITTADEFWAADLVCYAVELWYEDNHGSYDIEVEVIDDAVD